MLTPVNESKCAEVLSGIAGGMIIAYRKQCPHCMNMTKVVEKCAAMIDVLTALGLDTEENPALCAELGIERAPTVLIISGGRIAERAAGLMNPRGLAAVCRGAVSR